MAMIATGVAARLPRSAGLGSLSQGGPAAAAPAPASPSIRHRSRASNPRPIPSFSRRSACNRPSKSVLKARHV